jgi:putative endonuclease
MRGSMLGALVGRARALLARLALRRTLTGKALGRAGERLAERHLRKQGYTLLARNVVVAPGEADLVCAAPDGVTLVIVEVKTRVVASKAGEGTRAGAIAPEANIHAHKRRKLRQVTRAVAARPDWRGRPVRIDVVAVEWSPSGQHVIRHHVSAVR